MNNLNRAKILIFLASIITTGSLFSMNQTFIQVISQGYGNTIIINNAGSSPIIINDVMDIVTSDDDEMDIDTSWLNEVSTAQNDILPLSNSHEVVTTGSSNNCVDLSEVEDNRSDDEGIINSDTLEPLTCAMCQTEYEEQDVNMNISCCQGYHVFCTACITDWKRTKNSCPTPGCTNRLDQLISNNHTQGYLKNLEQSLTEHDVRKKNVLKFFLKKKQNQPTVTLPRIIVNLDQEYQGNAPRNTRRNIPRIHGDNNRINPRNNNGQASNPIVIEGNPRGLGGSTSNRFFRLNNVAPDIQEIIIIEDDVVTPINNSNVVGNSNTSNTVVDAPHQENQNKKDQVISQEVPHEGQTADDSLFSSVRSTVQSYCTIS